MTDALTVDDGPIIVEQSPDRPVFLHRHMQIHARRQQTRMPRRSFDLGQRPSPRQRMANERVPAVMDRKAKEAF